MSGDRTPVLVGVDQLLQRDAEPAEALEPLEMLERMARGCFEDAGLGAGLLNQIDTLALVSVIGWRAQNAPRLVAERLGIKPKHELLTTIGGEMGVSILNRLAESIASGDSRAALLLGCNNLRTLMAARKQQVDLGWATGGEGEPTLFGGDQRGSNEREQVYGLAMPTDVYPLFENALRAHRGLDLETHRQRMGALFSRFSSVAAKNRHAWFPTERSAEELTTVTALNRMIAFPYPKYLNAILNTDQAAGLLLMSAEAAAAFGVPEDQWVYWCGGAADEERAWFPSERPDFHSSEALRATGERALATAGVSLEEVDHIDLYSCFPSAVAMACEMLGLDESDPRGFTVTGGLPYAGGPGNSYTLHSVASMVEVLRRQRGVGLVTGNGWYLTKHSAVLLSATPPERRGELPSEAERRTGVEVLEEAAGRARVETYTVLYGRDGAPERGIVIARQSDGGRFIANTPPDRELLEDLVSREAVGLEGRVENRDGRNCFTPS